MVASLSCACMIVVRLHGCRAPKWLSCASMVTLHLHGCRAPACLPCTCMLDLMANLYATVEFLKVEIREKNIIIKSLLDSQSILQKKLIETKPTCHNSNCLPNCETPNPLASSITDGNNSALYQLVDEFNNNEHSFEDNLRSNNENLIATSNNSVSPIDLNPANDHILENDATESAIKENLEVVYIS